MLLSSSRFLLLWVVRTWVVCAEVEPIATYTDFGEHEYLVADERGYEHVLYKMAEGFLLTENGDIVDSRLKLNKVDFFLDNKICQLGF